MSTPEITINSIDVRKEFGVVFGTDLTDALLMPPAVKDPIQSNSRLEDGVRTIIPTGSVRVTSRQITLEIGITAPDRATFLTRHEGFMALLTSGWLNIQTIHIPGKTFRCRYVSCSQFTNFNKRIAKYILKLEEPNPNNRA